MPAGPFLGFVTSFILCFVAGSTFHCIIGLVSGLVIGPAFGSIIFSTFSIIAGYKVLVVINYKVNFFYKKQITAEDLTNSKLYIKIIISIKKILFCEEMRHKTIFVVF